MRQRIAVYLPLGGPLAGDMADPVAGQLGQGPGGGVGPQQREVLVARVAQYGAALDDVRVLAHRVVQGDVQGMDTVAELQDEFGGARCRFEDPVSGGLPFEGT